MLLQLVLRGTAASAGWGTAASASLGSAPARWGRAPAGYRRLTVGRPALWTTPIQFNSVFVAGVTAAGAGAAKAGVKAGKMETVVDENAAMVLQGPQSQEVILAVVAVEAQAVAAEAAADAQVLVVVAVGVAEEGDVSGHAGDALLGVGEHNTTSQHNPTQK